VAFELAEESGIYNLPDPQDETKPYFIMDFTGNEIAWMVAQFMFGKKIEEGEFETASASRLEELLGATNNFKHLGINAGYGVDDPNCEFPLIWCQTPNQAVMTPEARTEGKLYYSGVTGICPNNENTYLANGRPNRIRKDVFRCFYQGDACLFVTSGVFNISNTANPSVGSIQPHGSIYLDYIHFEPVIEEDDEE
jgi:hypothetical protein